MKTLTQFRDDLRARMADRKTCQSDLAKISGVDQASLSRFLRLKAPEGLSGSAILRLYPFVYPASEVLSAGTEKSAERQGE